MTVRYQSQKPVLLALGANLPSLWGDPPETFVHALSLLAAGGFGTLRTSSLYRTDAVGPGLQNRYYNAVVVGVTDVPPSALLRLAKRIERAAGRRRGRFWGPRPLDIDIIDYKGLRLGREGRQRIPGQLIIPHPELHKRTFVLEPLIEVMPAWRHPLSGVGPVTLKQRLPFALRGGVGQRLAFPSPLCE